LGNLISTHKRISFGFFGFGATTIAETHGVGPSTLSIISIFSKKGQPKMCVQLNDSEVDMLIDTGSSINVIDEKTFKNLKCDAKLSKANTKVYTYGSNNTLQLMGNLMLRLKVMIK
jgi:predicted aspartyl protease